MKTILYIEDNALNVRLISKYLQKVEIHLRWAFDANSGINLAIEQDFDLILLDINLPDMDGLSVARYLRQHPKTTKTPIIALTANAMHGDRDICLQAGCNDYLAKPIARQELLNMIAHHLS